MPSSESVTPDRRSEEVEKYVLHDETGGTKSHLFSQCVEDERTVEGVLYSITVSGDEKYVRFVPKEKMEFQWTIVDLGDGKGIVDCAQKAYELSAYMFKFDGSCNVALNSAYDPKSEQACDRAATEVVYITSKTFSVVGGEVVPVGERRGCLYNSPQGIKYGDEYGHLVSEVQLPPPDVCSPTADKGYHLVADCSLDKMNFCEAQARCEARGVPMASKIFFDELAAFEDWTSHPTDVGAVIKNRGIYGSWANITNTNNAWKWMLGMEVNPESDVVDDTSSDIECDAIYMSNIDDKASIAAVNCFARLYCVHCHDPNSLLPQC